MCNKKYLNNFKKRSNVNKSKYINKILCLFILTGSYYTMNVAYSMQSRINNSSFIPVQINNAGNEMLLNQTRNNNNNLRTVQNNKKDQIAPPRNLDNYMKEIDEAINNATSSKSTKQVNKKDTNNKHLSNIQKKKLDLFKQITNPLQNSKDNLINNNAIKQNTTNKLQSNPNKNSEQKNNMYLIKKNNNLYLAKQIEGNPNALQILANIKHSPAKNNISPNNTSLQANKQVLQKSNNNKNINQSQIINFKLNNTQIQNSNVKNNSQISNSINNNSEKLLTQNTDSNNINNEKNNTAKSALQKRINATNNTNNRIKLKNKKTVLRHVEQPNTNNPVLVPNNTNNLLSLLKKIADEKMGEQVNITEEERDLYNKLSPQIKSGSFVNKLRREQNNDDDVKSNSSNNESEDNNNIKRLKYYTLAAQYKIAETETEKENIIKDLEDNEKQLVQTVADSIKPGVINACNKAIFYDSKEKNKEDAGKYNANINFLSINRDNVPEEHRDLYAFETLTNKDNAQDVKYISSVPAQTRNGVVNINMTGCANMQDIKGNNEISNNLIHQRERRNVHIEESKNLDKYMQEFDNIEQNDNALHNIPQNTNNDFQQSSGNPSKQIKKKTILNPGGVMLQSSSQKLQQERLLKQQNSNNIILENNKNEEMILNQNNSNTKEKISNQQGNNNEKLITQQTPNINNTESILNRSNNIIRNNNHIIEVINTDINPNNNSVSLNNSGNDADNSSINSEISNNTNERLMHQQINNINNPERLVHQQRDVINNHERLIVPEANNNNNNIILRNNNELILNPENNENINNNNNNDHGQGGHGGLGGFGAEGPGGFGAGGPGGYGGHGDPDGAGHNNGNIPSNNNEMLLHQEDINNNERMLIQENANNSERSLHQQSSNMNNGERILNQQSNSNNERMLMQSNNNGLVESRLNAKPVVLREQDNDEQNVVKYNNINVAEGKLTLNHEKIEADNITVGQDAKLKIGDNNKETNIGTIQMGLNSELENKGKENKVNVNEVVYEDNKTFYLDNGNNENNKLNVEKYTPLSEKEKKKENEQLRSKNNNKDGQERILEQEKNVLRNNNNKLRSINNPNLPTLRPDYRSLWLMQEVNGKLQLTNSQAYNPNVNANTNLILNIHLNRNDFLQSIEKFKDKMTDPYYSAKYINNYDNTRMEGHLVQLSKDLNITNAKGDKYEFIICEDTLYLVKVTNDNERLLEQAQNNNNGNVDKSTLERILNSAKENTNTSDNKNPTSDSNTSDNSNNISSNTTDKKNDKEIDYLINLNNIPNDLKILAEDANNNGGSGGNGNNLNNDKIREILRKQLLDPASKTSTYFADLKYKEKSGKELLDEAFDDDFLYLFYPVDANKKKLFVKGEISGLNNDNWNNNSVLIGGDILNKLLSNSHLKVSLLGGTMFGTLKSNQNNYKAQEYFIGPKVSFLHKNVVFEALALYRHNNIAYSGDKKNEFVNNGFSLGGKLGVNIPFTDNFIAQPYVQALYSQFTYNKPLKSLLEKHQLDTAAGLKLGFKLPHDASIMAYYQYNSKPSLKDKNGDKLTHPDIKGSNEVGLSLNKLINDSIEFSIKGAIENNKDINSTNNKNKCNFKLNAEIAKLF